MKRKSLQDVMKMTEKQRFMYYTRLTWGNVHFSGQITPGAKFPYISLWEYEGEENRCIGLMYLDSEEDIIKLEKHIDKWL